MVFIVCGVFVAMIDSVQRTFVADLAPPRLSGQCWVGCEVYVF